ncbi:MAG: hypothetical protein KA184_08780, partial [Candidatus Hydrogenedentes bacterium]|nr:hypothetical protein [Candidatus Hydrogenedentota bacterium]
MNFTQPVLFVTFLSGLFAGQAPDAAELVRPTGPEQRAQASGGEPVLRMRPVAVDAALLSGPEASKGALVRLVLFDGVVLDSVLEKRIDHGSDSFTWRGTVPGDAEGYLVASVHDGALTAVAFTRKHGLFEVRGTAQGYVARELDAERCCECFALPAPGSGRGSPPGPAAAATKEDPAEIDVLVVYTPNVLAEAGSEAAVLSETNLAVDLANTGYENSLINVRLRLVRTELVTYTENGDMGIDLALLTGPDDSFMDQVHTWRNQSGADMVALLVAFGDACGIAWIMTDNSPSAAGHMFSVTEHGCIGTHTFAHELGHNMGCAHDRENATGGIFPYSWGWRFTGLDSVLYRTVMSYAP